MHSAFLYHATRQGLDMSIVNAGMLEVYDNIPGERLELIEDVLLNRRPDATERLTDYAEKLAAEKAQAGAERKPVLAWREQPVTGRLEHALVKGITEFVDADTEEAFKELGSPLKVIEGPADGRHEGGGGTVRRRKDVPAPGGEERPCDEAGRGMADPVH